MVLYAIAARRLPSPLPPGAEGEPLVQLEVEGVVGIAGAVEATPEPIAAAAVAHGRVVEALAGLADPVLPARFGSVHPSPEALADALASNSDALAAALRAVEGCVEVGVRGIPSAPEPENAPANGREYLERRRAAVGLVERVHEPLAAQARAARLERGSGFAASYLVPREELDAFLDAVREADGPELALVSSGPWPPYSFAGVGA
jgi:gas vesicle protein GvpL/GvpF